MRYTQDDVHAVLMAAATIYSANPTAGKIASVEDATELLESTRKHLEHQNLQIEVNEAYDVARTYQLMPNDIKSLDGSLLPDPKKNAFIRPESTQNLRDSILAAIKKTKRADADEEYVKAQYEQELRRGKTDAPTTSNS